MWGPLTIIDMGRELRVAPIADPDDWVVCFAKKAGFPAQEWAARIIALHNAAPQHEQVASDGTGGPSPVTGYHPNQHGSAEL